MSKTLDSLSKDVEGLVDEASYVQTTFEDENYEEMASELEVLISDAAGLLSDMRYFMKKGTK